MNFLIGSFMGSCFIDVAFRAKSLSEKIPMSFPFSVTGTAPMFFLDMNFKVFWSVVSGDTVQTSFLFASKNSFKVNICVLTNAGVDSDPLSGFYTGF